jgi:hypothetical protein
VPVQRAGLVLEVLLQESDGVAHEYPGILVEKSERSYYGDVIPAAPLPLSRGGLSDCPKWGRLIVTGRYRGRDSVGYGAILGDWLRLSVGSAYGYRLGERSRTGGERLRTVAGFRSRANLERDTNGPGWGPGAAGWSGDGRGYPLW